jgi:hypothetical protein
MHEAILDIVKAMHDLKNKFFWLSSKAFE